MAERMSLKCDEGLLEIVTSVDTLEPGLVTVNLLRDGEESATWTMTYQQARVLATHLDVCSEMAEAEEDCADEADDE